MCLAQLHVGDLVAIGIDPSGRYLLTVSHSGRGIFDTNTWQRVARDPKLSYPTEGRAVGIGPLAGQSLPVTEINYNTSTLDHAAVSEKYVVSYTEGVVTIDSTIDKLSNKATK
jgi:hypothetical protein